MVMVMTSSVTSTASASVIPFPRPTVTIPPHLVPSEEEYPANNEEQEHEQNQLEE